MGCCTCSGNCNHVGPHMACFAHGGPLTLTGYTSTTTYTFPAPTDEYVGKHRRKVADE